jgi:MFS transporter, LPLT family, lysophospholipid transporter
MNPPPRYPAPLFDLGRPAGVDRGPGAHQGPYPRGFHWLVAAQFSSGLADHALLIVSVAFLHEQGYPAWWAPLLKFAFTWAYVLLAPFVGALADAFPKGALMGWMNGVKVLGLLALVGGAHPVLAFAIIGLGASVYAPAKYGLITETVRPGRLVAANGWLEVTVVLSVLLGTGLGGLLASQGFAHHRPWSEWGLFSDWGVPSGLHLPFEIILCIFLLAAVLNLGVPRSPVRTPVRTPCARPSTVGLLAGFRQANRALWQDPLGRLSLAVTTVFWGAGAVLQFAVLRWSEAVLGLPLHQAAYLQASVALGVVAGATVAARWVSLPRAKAVLPWGIVLGLLVALAAWSPSWEIALPLMLLTGAVGGILVVPMNALLQYRGHRLLSPGRSVAVQGFNENLSVLLMLGLYAALLRLEVPIVALMTAFGLVLAAGMSAITWQAWQTWQRHTPLQGPTRRAP